MDGQQQTNKKKQVTIAIPFETNHCIWQKENTYFDIILKATKRKIKRRQ